MRTKFSLRFFWACLAILLTAVPVWSQKVGTTSMQFLKVMPCARATAMGDAYVVFATGAEAAFWNPAGVEAVRGNELSLTYIDWIFDTYQGALSYAFALEGWGAVGLQLQYVDYGTFDETDLGGVTGRQFHPVTYLAGVSYASALTDRFTTGVTIKYVYESLFDKSNVPVLIGNNVENLNTYAQGLLFDFGFTYSTGFRSVKIATSIQNFGSSVRYAKEFSPVPVQFRLGIGADLLGANSLFAEDENNRLSAEFDLFQPNDYAQQIHAGVEYEFAKTLSLRAGYKFNYDFDGLTIGGGIKREMEGMQLSIDYSYGSMGAYLGNVHRVSLGAILL